MAQAGFDYHGTADVAANDAGLSLALSIFADRPHVRDTMRDDALAAGFRLHEARDVAALLDDQARPLGEVVLLDCPVVDAATMAALARLEATCWAFCGAAPALVGGARLRTAPLPPHPRNTVPA